MADTHWDIIMDHLKKAGDQFDAILPQDENEGLGQMEEILAVTPVVLCALGVNPDWVRVVGIQFSLSFLRQSILRNSLESLLDVDSLLGRSFKVRNVALGLTPCHCSFLGHHPLRLLHINLVAQYHKREVLGVMGRGLHQKLISPAIKRFERLVGVDIVYEDTAVGSTVESDT